MHTPLIICPDVDTEVRYDLNPTDATDTVLPRKQAQNKPWYREFSKKPW